MLACTIFLGWIGVSSKITPVRVRESLWLWLNVNKFIVFVCLHVCVCVLQKATITPTFNQGTAIKGLKCWGCGQLDAHLESDSACWRTSCLQSSSPYKQAASSVNWSWITFLSCSHSSVNTYLDFKRCFPLDKDLTLSPLSGGSFPPWPVDPLQLFNFDS